VRLFLRPLGPLLVKDVAILRRSPLLVAILVIYPVALALMIGLALSSPPGSPRVAIYSGVTAGHGTIEVGGQRVDIGAYTRQLSASITPIDERSPAAAVAAVRSGRAEAAIIVPAQIIAQVQDLISQGVGAPTVQLVLNDRSPLERAVAEGEIQTRIDQVQSAISKALLATALGDLHRLVAGGELSFAGARVSLLGLRNTRTIIQRAIPLIRRAGLGASLAPALRQVVDFATLATDGVSFASPVLGQIQSPLTVQRRELTGTSTPTASYAVAIAVAVSELFLALLLAAALLALERSEQVYARLVRGPLSPGMLLAEKVLLSALAATAVSLVMSAVVSVFISLAWAHFELWVAALLLAGLAFAALGVALGALAREVAAASLLAILVGLPVAFLALVPASAVSSGLGQVLSVISFLFPFKAGLEAVSNALTQSGPGIGGPLVHLVLLTGVYLVAGRVALLRFAD
jgi:ABC-type multidrug transport system permease subunit